MKRFMAFVVICAVPFCGSRVMAERIQIVTTTSDLAAIAKAVTRDRAVVHSVCSGKEDPHMLQAKPSVVLQARNADLWIRVGLELEIGWDGPILNGSRNTRIQVGSPGHLDASESALILDVPTVPISRAMGDVHPLGNPHYWLDPLNGRRIAAAIADRLAVLRPEDAAVFRENAAAFQRELDERMFGRELPESLGPDVLWSKAQDSSLSAFLDTPEHRSRVGGWVAAMAPLRGWKIVTYHKSWVYFANRFGLEVVGELEPKPGVPPTAAHLSELAQLAKAKDVRLVLQEPFYSTKAAKQLADKIGARVVLVANSVGGESEATDYLTLMDLIVRRVSVAAIGE